MQPEATKGCPRPERPPYLRDLCVLRFQSLCCRCPRPRRCGGMAEPGADPAFRLLTEGGRSKHSKPQITRTTQIAMQPRGGRKFCPRYNARLVSALSACIRGSKPLPARTWTSAPTIRALGDLRRINCPAHLLQTLRQPGLLGSTSCSATGPMPQIAITAGSVPSAFTPS
jgi:hypothetical protein